MAKNPRKPPTKKPPVILYSPELKKFLLEKNAKEEKALFQQQKQLGDHVTTTEAWQKTVKLKCKFLEWNYSYSKKREIRTPQKKSWTKIILSFLLYLLKKRGALWIIFIVVIILYVSGKK